MTLLHFVDSELHVINGNVSSPGCSFANVQGDQVDL